MWESTCYRKKCFCIYFCCTCLSWGPWTLSSSLLRGASSSLSRVQSWTPWIGRPESSTLDHQGSPSWVVFIDNRFPQMETTNNQHMDLKPVGKTRLMMLTPKISPSANNQFKKIWKILRHPATTPPELPLKIHLQKLVGSSDLLSTNCSFSLPGILH